MKKKRGSECARMTLGAFTAVGLELPDRFVTLEWAEEGRTAVGGFYNSHGMEVCRLDELSTIAERVRTLEAKGATVTATVMDRSDVMTDTERHAIEAAIFVR